MGYVEKRYGNYRARYRDPNGRARSETFTRKMDAERFLRDVQVEVERGRWLDPRGANMTLAEWSEEYLRLARRLAKTTQDTYRRDITKYVLPRFGDYRIGRIPADEVENWLNDEIDAGIAPSSVHRHYRTIHRMLEVAVEKKRLVANPCEGVQPPRVPDREMAFLSWDEVLDLAEAHSARYRAFIYLAVDSGMRWSELVGLRRGRVDLPRRKVRVTEQHIRLNSGEWIRKEPKANSMRSITISEFTASVLAAHLDEFAQEGRDGLVFPNGASHPIASSSFWNNHFTPALRKAGLRCRFHDLRHTSVALAIEAGVHPKAIQTRMGHSSINVTLDRYGHLFPELDEAIATSFGERLTEAQARRNIRSAPHISLAAS